MSGIFNSLKKRVSDFNDRIRTNDDSGFEAIPEPVLSDPVEGRMDRFVNAVRRRFPGSEVKLEVKPDVESAQTVSIPICKEDDEPHADAHGPEADESESLFTEPGRFDRLFNAVKRVLPGTADAKPTSSDTSPPPPENRSSLFQSIVRRFTTPPEQISMLPDNAAASAVIEGIAAEEAAAPSAHAEKQERTLRSIVESVRESVNSKLDSVLASFGTQGMLKVTVILKNGDKSEFRLQSVVELATLFAEPPWPHPVYDVDVVAEPADAESRLPTIPVEILLQPKLRKLTLVGQKLSILPTEIQQCLSLTHLDLSRNTVTFLPVNICKLSLTHLLMSRNALTHIPTELTALPLQVLDLSYNKLVGVPSEVFSIPTLRELNLAGNKLPTLPILEPGARLAPLTSLDISGNALSFIPPYICYIMTLTYLSAAHNKLSFLPGFIQQLTQLRTLDVSFNMLTMLPNEIMQLVHLDELNLSGNVFKGLPSPVFALRTLTVLAVSAIRVRT